MVDYLEESLGLYSPAFDPGKYEKYTEVFGSPQVLLIEPKIGIGFQPGTHSHETYEFFIPFRQPFLMQTSDQEVLLKPNSALLIPPEQAHGPAVATRGSIVLTIYVRKAFMQELYASVFGTNMVAFDAYQCLFTDVSYKKLVQMREEKKFRQAGFQFVIENLAVLMLVYLLRQLNPWQPEPLPEGQSRKATNIIRVIDFMHEHYNRDCTLKDLAAIAELSPYHFIRVFKDHTARTPFAYLMEIKIEKAKEMLKNQNRTVTEICYSCGFNNLNHFGNAFRRKVGLLPSEYRKYFL